MNSFKSLITKELIELRASKRIFIMGILGIFYPGILNYVAKSPVLPIEHCLVIFSIIGACVGAELIYAVMIEEIKYKTFDILLMSKVNSIIIIFGKIFIPIVWSLIVSICSLIVNDIFASFTLRNMFSQAFTFNNVLLLLFASLNCCLMEFMVSINKKFNTTIHTSILILNISIMSFLYFLMIRFGIWVFIFFSILLSITLMLLIIKKIKLFNRNNKIKKYNIKSLLFGNNDISQNKALLCKELLNFRFSKFIFIKIIVFALLPIFINLTLQNSFNIKKLFVFLSLFFICTIGSVSLLFPSLQNEKLNKSMIIFKLAKISKIKIYFFKCIVPLIISLIGLAFSIILNNLIYWQKSNLYVLLDIKALLLSLLTTLVSCIFCIIISYFINSYRENKLYIFIIFTFSAIFHFVVSYIFI